MLLRVAAWVCALVLPVAAVRAATFTVDTTSDAALQGCLEAVAGDCSLRGAIIAANGLAGSDTIAFALPQSDPGYQAATAHWRIVPAADLPNIEGQLVIDGFTQPGALPSTHLPLSPMGHVLKIELQGLTNSASTGLQALPGGSLTVRGLVINNFNRGIYLFEPGTYVLEGNYIGTDVSGMAAVPNRFGVAMGGDLRVGGDLPAQANLISGNVLDGLLQARQLMRLRVQGNYIGLNALGTEALPGQNYGLRLSGVFADVRIGGTTVAEANVISGNEVNAIAVFGSGAVVPGTPQARILGNLIGLSAVGATAVGNGLSPSQPGVPFSAIQVFRSGPCGVEIGGTAAGEGNLIAYSGRSAVLVSTCWSSPILGNSFLANRGIAIDLASTSNPDGPTPNDAGDADGTGNDPLAVSAGNRLQNRPELVEVQEDVESDQLRVALRVDSTPLASAYPLRLDFYRSDAFGILAPAATHLLQMVDAQLPHAFVLALSQFRGTVGVVATDADGNSSEMLLFGDIFADGFEGDRGGGN